MTREMLCGYLVNLKIKLSVLLPAKQVYLGAAENCAMSSSSRTTGKFTSRARERGHFYRGKGI